MNHDNDMPKKWTEVVDQENIENLPVEVEEEQSLPALSYEEQKELVEQEAPEEYKDMFGAIVEVSNMANLLSKIDTDESQYIRHKMLDIVSEEFVRKRMNTNVKLEEIKWKLIERVADNINQLDLTTAYEMAKGIHEMTQVEATAPMGKFSNPSIVPQPNTGPIINIATGEGNINTAAVAPSQVTNIPISTGSNMKTVSQMNEAVKGWQSVIKKPKKEPIDITPND